MRKAALILLLVLGNLAGAAQEDTIRLKAGSSGRQTLVTDRAPQALYLGIGGSGPFLSFNYDRRFMKKVNGPGFTAGLGLWGFSGLTVFSVPVSVNYLLGKDSHFLELAGGVTFLTTGGKLFAGNSNQPRFIFHFNAGYRYQPSRGGFFFRGGISPLFAGGEYVISYYLGFGHNF